MLFNDQNKPSYQLYGRRRGRKWNATHAAFLQQGLEIYQPNERSLRAPCDPKLLFDHCPEKVWLEMGFGYGEHLIAQAQNNPKVGILGAEIYLSGIAHTLRNLINQSIKNVRIIASDGRPFLDNLAPQTLDGFILLFPDPWFKARHEKRQLFQADFVGQLKRILKKGGFFRFASDDPSYSEKVRQEMENHPDFKLSFCKDSHNRPDITYWPRTRYEKKADLMKRVCHFFEYTLDTSTL